MIGLNLKNAIGEGEEVKMDVILSVKPSYAYAILSGAKTVELRRKFNEDIPQNSRVLIYASSPIKALVGECRIKKVTKDKPRSMWGKVAIESLISWSAYRTYFARAEHAYAIYLEAPLKYDIAISLETLRKTYNIDPPQSYRYKPDVSL